MKIKSKAYTVDGCQQLFVLVFPLEFGDAGFLGDFSQLMSGLVTLLLEEKGVALVVEHRGVVIRLRRVIRQGRIRGRCRGRIPLDEPEQTRSSETERNLGRIVREVDDHCLRHAPA
jgi:hypothetical protein